MNDIRDLLSGHLHVEQIVFTQAVGLDSEEPQTHCYLGAASTGRFLLMNLSSPTDADGPIVLSERGWIYARNANTDFTKRSNLPIVAVRPRSQREPDMERTFQAMESLLQGCLRLGLGLVKPGSIRWNGDRFTAEYASVDGGTRRGVKITALDGKEAPENVKAMILAEMEAEPKDRKHQATFVRKEHKVLRAGEAEAARRASEPVPGSIEARILARLEVKEKERFRVGIQGGLIRDKEGRVSEILLQSEPGCRVQLEYDQSASLSPPFPNRIRTFIEHAEAKPGVPNSEITVHSVRLSDKPLEDAAFDPSSRLKAGSFVRGVLTPDGREFVPDPTDRIFVHELVKARYFKRPGNQGLDASGPAV
jgi:hypothetical protein